MTDKESDGMKPIDSADAPDGCVAAPLQSRCGLCRGCCFDPDRDCEGHSERRCMPEERGDEHMVIFLRKEEKGATA